MMKEKIFEVKGYQLPKVNGMLASPGSFKLDLRETLKRYVRSTLYFEKNQYAKNFGCFVFGQPDKWKGVLGIEYQEPQGEYINIIIYIEKYRTPEEDVPKIKKIIQEGLKHLKRRGFIKDYNPL